MSERRIYDLAFGVGATCRCSMSLREGNLQYYSFAFDWTAGPRVIEKVNLLCRNFDGWMRKENFVAISDGKFSDHTYWHDDMGFVFVHEFADRAPFEERFPVVQKRLLNRGHRLFDMIGNAGRILVVFLQTPDCREETVEDMKKVRERLQTQWPDKTFDILLFNHADGVGRHSFEDFESDGVRRVRLDYRDRHERDGGWVADHVQVGKWLRSHYQVVDYRTPEERKNWKDRQRSEKLARFKATGWFDYYMTKFRYKLFVHLRKRLAKKGLI